MNFKDNPQEASFRAEVHQFIDENLPKDWKPALEGDYAAGADPIRARFEQRWRQALSARGWIAPHWPVEHGGAGLTLSEHFIFKEEMAEARAPSVGGFGVQMVGPMLIQYGTDEQKREHLPRITSGEVQWCQAYTEPGAGSDLASLQTQAVRDGDDYVVNGHKIWTGNADRSEWMFMLARTDPRAPKHRGISLLLVDMNTPGITVRPMADIAGQLHHSEEFFDNVRVPLKNRVGDENRGWYLGATILDLERSDIGGAIALRHNVGDIVRFVREATMFNASQVPRTWAIRAELAERALEAEVARLLSYRVVSMQKHGEIPNYEASVNKLFRSEVYQRIAQTGMKAIGLYGNAMPGSIYAVFNGQMPFTYIECLSAAFGAGTSEIQRNVIATRGLGLPRG